MASRGVDLISSPSDAPPYCVHGENSYFFKLKGFPADEIRPTLLFERFYADKKPRKFYACAVHRSRKGCQFFHWGDEPISTDSRERYMKLFHDHQESLIKMTGSIIMTQDYKNNELGFCIDCGKLYYMDTPNDHIGHNVRQRLSEMDLRQPTRLLYPLSDNKGQAQYLFSDKTQDFLLLEIKRLNISHVICLGTPRLHEDLLTSGLSSFLLDIDHRYHQFYDCDKFHRFNMFNGYFYSGEDGRQALKDFVKSIQKEQVLLVIDPPFGGLITALKTGINTIWQTIGQECSTLLVFPYFNEAHILKSFPNFVMLDYQVTYGNHHYYGDKGKRGKPSPARLFTNIPLPALHLPKEDGYKFCSICNRYVSLHNTHCGQCNACTSKDGRPYKHCPQCNVCVKEGRIHCRKCQSCQLPQHNCDTFVKIGCHYCGGLDHKRRHCPSRQAETSNDQKRAERKRKASKGGSKQPKKANKVDNR